MLSKIPMIFILHVSNATSARMLVEDLLKALPKEKSKTRQLLQACLPELRKNEVMEKEREAGVFKEQSRREHERQHFIFTHGHEPDPRDDPDWRPY